jgi:hypothetical protein
MARLVVAVGVVALLGWTLLCVMGIQSELAEPYDGFFTDFGVLFFIGLIAVPWLVFGSLVVAARALLARR